MKIGLATFTATLIMSSTIALAAPLTTAPAFSATTKTIRVAEGDFFEGSGKQLVIDGANMYAAFAGAKGEPSVVRSSDYGMTWGSPMVLANANAAGTVRIALASSPKQAGKKIVCVIWTDGGAIKFSYSQDLPTRIVWSPPATLPSAGITGIHPTTSRIATAPDGSIHIIFNADSGTYYTYALAADKSFSPPTKLGWVPVGDSLDIGADSNNAIYIAEITQNTSDRVLSLHKKTAGQSKWSDIKVAKDNNTSKVLDNPSIAVLDEKNIYIAYKRIGVNKPTTIWLASTTDGGKTWANNQIAPNAEVSGTYPAIAVSADKVISLTAHYEPEGSAPQVLVNKSADGGATWSPSVKVAGDGFPSIAINSNGKTCILSISIETADPSITGSTEKRALIYTMEM